MAIPGRSTVSCQAQQTLARSMDGTYLLFGSRNNLFRNMKSREVETLNDCPAPNSNTQIMVLTPH